MPTTERKTPYNELPYPTAVFDNRRRGAPVRGCDCIQCFGYCIRDEDKARRDGFSFALDRKRVKAEETSGTPFALGDPARLKVSER